MNQLEIHKRIEEFLKGDIASADVNVAKGLLINDDAKRYFFTRADNAWLDWIWKNGFLDQIKEPAADTSKYQYRLSELEYLTRMAEQEPEKVAKIIDAVKSSEGGFNPEVIDRFIWIIGSMPAEQAKALTAKIRDEKWIYLMRSFRRSGYEFERIIKKLSEKRDDAALIELAQAIFLIKKKDEIAKNELGFSMEYPFYVQDLDASGIFEALNNISDSFKEKALQLVAAVMASVVKLSEPDDSKIFEYNDQFSLFDVDFFDIKIENNRGYSDREDIKNLAAVIKGLIEETIGKKCGDAPGARRLFSYVDQIPSSRSMWRLRLFALAQCPEVFKEELKSSFFKLFEVEHYYEIEGGSEYKRALNIGFSHLSDTDKRAYVEKVFKYFQEKDQKNPDQAWHKRTGWEILSSICGQLTKDELNKCEEAFGSKCDEKYKPEPSVGKMQAGSVNHRSPANLNDYSIEKIVENLKSVWSPEKLKEEFKDDDFFQPRGTEGLAEELKENTKIRLDEYLKNINKFFDREKIHPHYLYSLLRGIEEILRNRQLLNAEQVAQILGLFEVIKKDGLKSPFQRKDDKSWLADWVTVHKVIADILLFILEDKEKRLETQQKYREEIKNIILYLFTINESPSKEDEKPEYGELYGVAINSVRGRSYEAFVIFTENDGKTLAEDIKEIYRHILLDKSLAVHFVIGRYLATFYFRDKEFITESLAAIFPKDIPEKKDIYLATWEGYLSNTLYDQMFVALKDYYKHAITLDSKDYTQRKYWKGLDETLAVHLALAFAHLGLEIEDSLFAEFWSNPNTKRHQEFISFIGRSCLTRDQAGDKWLKENKVSKEKLLRFWDWALVNVSQPEALSGFGYWVNPDEEVLDDSSVVERMALTLKKSDGDIDWDYGLLRRLPVFAEKEKEKTLEIISGYLLDSKKNLNQNRKAPLLYQSEVKKALGVIYENSEPDIKQKVTDLINLLIEKGSSMFWDLKDVIK